MFELRSTPSQHAATATQLETRYLLRSSRASATIRCAAFAILALAPLALGQTAHAATTTEGGAVTVTPGGSYTSGLRVAVVSATDTAGDAVTAQRALMAANMAIARTRGYMAIPQSAVASAMSSSKNAIDARGPNQQRGVTDPQSPLLEPTNSDTRVPVDTLDYKAIGKSTKADRLLSVIINRGDSSDTSATVNAIVEIYDAKTGGMVGRGESSFTSSVAAADDVVKPANANDIPVVNGRARTAAANAEAAQVLALGGAVYRAIGELNRPVELQGVIISMPEAYQARISLGEREGIRSGARIEFLNGDTAVAYGTVISAGRGESLVTVAPEAAFPSIYRNMPVRNVSNPVIARSGKSEFQIDDAEFKRFERDFGVGLLAAGLLYAFGAFEKIENKLPLND